MMARIAFALCVVWVAGFWTVVGMWAWNSVNAQADAITAQHGSEAVAAMEDAQ